MDDIPILGRDDDRRLFQQFAAHYDVPAFIRRARQVQEAFDDLVNRCRQQRALWLDQVRIPMKRLQALAGDGSVLGSCLQDGGQIACTVICRDTPATVLRNGRVDSFDSLHPDSIFGHFQLLSCIAWWTIHSIRCTPTAFLGIFSHCHASNGGPFIRFDAPREYLWAFSTPVIGRMIAIHSIRCIPGVFLSILATAMHRMPDHTPPTHGRPCQTQSPRRRHPPLPISGCSKERGGVAHPRKPT